MSLNEDLSKLTRDANNKLLNDTVLDLKSRVDKNTDKMIYNANKGYSEYDLIYSFTNCYRLNQSSDILNQEKYKGLYYNYLGSAESLFCVVSVKWSDKPKKMV